MEILIESTKQFHQDLACFSKENKANIIEQINKIFQLYYMTQNPYLKTKALLN